MRKSQYGNSIVSQYDSSLNVKEKAIKNRQWIEKGMNKNRKSRSFYGLIQEKSKAINQKPIVVYSQRVVKNDIWGSDLSLYK